MPWSYGAQMDLQRIIFQDILKISPQLLAKYPTVQDQLLYLIFIPHIILLMALVMIANNISREHKMIRNLFIFGGYLYFIWSGWYGSWFAALASALWIYLLGGLTILFFLRYFIPYEKIFSFVELGGKMGLRPKDLLGLTAKEQLQLLQKELRKINKKLISYGVKIHEKEKKLDISEEINEVVEKERKEYVEKYGGLSEKHEEALEKFRAKLYNLAERRAEIISMIEEIKRTGRPITFTEEK